MSSPDGRVLLAILLLGLIAAWGLADAQVFTPVKPKCYFSAYHVAVRSLPDHRRTVVWWCKHADGLDRYSRSEDHPHGGPTNAVTLNDVALWAIDQAHTHRRHTDAERTLVSEAEREEGPRCYARTTGGRIMAPIYGRNADGTRGPRRVGRDAVPLFIAQGAEVSCRYRLRATYDYCLAQFRTASSGEIIPLDSYALCRYERAPSGGWPDAATRIGG